MRRAMQPATSGEHFRTGWFKRAAAFALITIACSPGTAPDVVPAGALRVLFIGNSLTQFNQLTRMLEAIADSAGGRPIYAREVTFGGVSLEDHWGRGDALAAIDGRRWDVVVLQQGPSSLDTSRANLIEWTGRFATRIRAAGAEPALYQVWPEDDRRDVFDRVLDSYRLAAESVDGELLPAGAAWVAAWQQDPGLPLYGPDGFHPSATGTYLAAITIYAELLDRTAVGLPAQVSIGNAAPIVSLPPARAAVLQAAADAVTMP